MSHPAYLCLALASLLLPPSGSLAAEDVRDASSEPLPNGALLRLGTTRLRPAGNVGHMAFSPDGRKLASWSNELYVTDTLSIWDVRTGRLMRRVDLPGARVQS